MTDKETKPEVKFFKITVVPTELYHDWITWQRMANYCSGQHTYLQVANALQSMIGVLKKADGENHVPEAIVAFLRDGITRFAANLIENRSIKDGDIVTTEKKEDFLKLLCLYYIYDNFYYDLKQLQVSTDVWGKNTKSRKIKGFLNN